LRDRGQDFDLVAAPAAETFQKRDIAGALRAEAKILADQEPPRLEPLRQHLLDEGIRRQRRERAVEPLNVGALHAVRREQLDLLAQRRQARGRGPRGEEFAWVGLEGEHTGLQPARSRAREQALQQGLVPAVDAVEIPDGERGRQRRGGGAVVSSMERKEMA